jgi:hypothetical protein
LGAAESGEHVRGAPSAFIVKLLLFGASCLLCPLCLDPSLLLLKLLKLAVQLRALEEDSAGVIRVVQIDDSSTERAAVLVRDGSGCGTAGSGVLTQRFDS